MKKEDLVEVVPREWMIAPANESMDEIVCDLGYEKNFPSVSFYHVVEHSAYAAALERIKYLEQYVANQKNELVKTWTHLDELEKTLIDETNRNANVRDDLERERMRLAGCGVAALMNTKDSVAHRITSDNPYYSASYRDVCDTVDREMRLREERDLLVKEIEILRIKLKD